MLILSKNFSNTPPVLIKRCLSAFIFTFTLPLSVAAVEFNVDMIDVEDRDNIDISRFEKKGHITPGNYLVRVQINKNTLPAPIAMTWFAADNEYGSRLCLTRKHLIQFGLNDDFINGLKALEGSDCLDLSANTELTWSLNKANMVLQIVVPQAWMKYQAQNWTSPEYWDEGVTGMLLDYNVYASQYNPDSGNTSQNVSAYGTLGFNLGAWRLRSDFQHNQNFINGQSVYADSSLPRTWLYRPIPSLAAKLSMGQYNLSSDIFDTFQFTGASLESDESMLPPDLKGYAPQITGIAETNAKVTVSQSGRVLYQTNVPPGPFVLSDLGETYQGQLDVEVEEEDGRKSTFQVGSASVPYLTRKGQVRYKTSVGKPGTSGRNNLVDPLFWTGEASWGWLSNVSLYGGALLTVEDYQSLTSGVGFNLNALGALSVDATGSQAHLGQESEKQRGFSYRANYARRFESTGSQISFSGYRFSDENYVSMNEYLASRSGSSSQNNEKESYVLSFNQYVDALALNTYLNIARNTYWDARSSTYYSLSLSRSFDIGRLRGLSTSLSLSRVHWNNEDENQLYFSFSLPLEPGRNLMYGYQRSGSHSPSHMASFYDVTDRNNTWNLSTTATEDDMGNGEPSLRAGFQHYSPYGRMSVNGSLQPHHYNAANLGWNGSFTATRFGMALHDYSPSDGARMMVDAQGVQGIEVNSTRSVTNSQGIAVVPSLTSYSTATVSVDSSKLPEGVDITTPVLSTTLTQGAIGYAQLSATKGYQIVGIVRTQEGNVPPLGISVIEASSGREAGIVAEEGFVYLSGIQENSTLRLSWADNTCEITPPNQSNIHESAIILPCKTGR
ncbi:fimbria/pilus outer membrane usher protein [Enterobacter sp. 186315]